MCVLQPYGQPGYGQPAYGQPVYGQPGYGPPGEISLYLLLLGVIVKFEIKLILGTSVVK